MDESVFKERVARLREIDAVISRLDPALRADALEMLKPYVTGESVVVSPPSPGTRRSSGRSRSSSPRPKATTPKQAPLVASPAEDEDALLEQHLSDHDHENAMLALALFYKRHGRGPFSMSYVEAIARQHHLNMPKRLDKFFGRARRGEARVLVVRRQADGWKVTPSGETWIKATYGVAMGRDPLPVAAS